MSRWRSICLRGVMTSLLALLFASHCWAQQNLPTDAIGIFFDETGCTYCAAPSPYMPMTAYLLMLGPSASGDITGWECSVPTDPASFPAGITVTIEGGGVIQSTWPELRVPLSSPLPRAPIVHLATFSTFYLGDPILFGIGPTHPSSLPANPSPAYFALPEAETPRPLAVWLDSPPMPTAPDAFIAADVAASYASQHGICPRTPWCEAPVLVIPETWGAVKGLYR